ncbi:MAG: hypothetical protein WD773_02960 [Gemmatimonadales bacterium]
MPVAAARNVPAAVEPDVFRSLTLIPAVSFSTPLSARPIIRGYDAAEGSVRIDGFEVVNLYHIGRVFAAFPAGAASEVAVAAAPQGVANGGTLSGILDITGRVGEPGRAGGGADLSLASATVWAGGGGRDLQWFGTIRAVHLSLLNSLSQARVPYNFQDFYASALISSKGRPAVKITAFASQDELFDQDIGAGMDWSNILVGTRWQALQRGRVALSIWGNVNRFQEDVVDLPARFSRINVRNRFERAGMGVDILARGPAFQIAGGLSGFRRVIGNRIVPVGGDDFPATDARYNRAELGAFGELTVGVGRASLQTGIRLDAAGQVHVLQPRARLAMSLGPHTSVGIAVGRTARLFHLVSDPQSEPDLAFYDFWLNAGTAGVPIPRVDHATFDFDVGRGSIAARLSLFASFGRGLVELRPSTDQRGEVETPFRYGNGRSRGLEVQLALRGSTHRQRALSLAYVYSVADRNWGTAWTPWTLDRRHMLRVIGRTEIREHWSLAAVLEATSGAPLTLVDGVVLVGEPGDTGTLMRWPFGRPAYIYGTENGARSAGTARVDLSGTFAFTGPWNTRMNLGLSIVNAGFGPVAPLRPSRPGFDPGPSPQGRVRYERLFDLPAVPSVTFRVEF